MNALLYLIIMRLDRKEREQLDRQGSVKYSVIVVARVITLLRTADTCLVNAQLLLFLFFLFFFLRAPHGSTER